MRPTSLIRAAPAFSMGSANSIARAMVTPSLTTFGLPNSSRTTFLPTKCQGKKLINNLNSFIQITIQYQQQDNKHSTMKANGRFHWPVTGVPAGFFLH